MKKYISGLILGIYMSLTHADIPKSFNVYINGSGLSTTLCRAVVDEYNKMYNSQSVLVSKPGAAGLIATLEMVKDKNFSFYCFAAASELVFNRTVYPGHEKEHDMLTPVTLIAEAPIVFNTRVSNSVNTLPELIASNKPLTVGYHTTTALILGKKIFNNGTTTFVAYKAAHESLASLIDGSVDVYIDGGTLSGKNYVGVLKSLGHIYGPKSTPGVNITNTFANSKIPRSVSAMMTSTNNASYIEELNRRLNIILKHDSIVNIITSLNNQPLYLSVKESNEYIDSIRKFSN